MLAGAEGLEPSRTVLETAMLPLHHAPLCGQRLHYNIGKMLCQRLLEQKDMRVFMRKRIDNAM